MRRSGPCRPGNVKALIQAGVVVRVENLGGEIGDARRPADPFGLRTSGGDCIVEPGGRRYLFEANHVRDVSVFPEVRAAYLDLVIRWAGDPPPD